MPRELPRRQPTGRARGGPRRCQSACPRRLPGTGGSDFPPDPPPSTGTASCDVPRVAEYFRSLPRRRPAPRPSRLGRRSGPGLPPERADQLEVLVAERLGLGIGQGERDEQLVALGASDQVIVPEHAQFSFASLRGQLVAEAPRRVAVDLARAEELAEPPP